MCSEQASQVSELASRTSNQVSQASDQVSGKNTVPVRLSLV